MRWCRSRNDHWRINGVEILQSREGQRTRQSLCSLSVLLVKRFIIPATLQGNNAFRSQDFETAIKQYTKAFDIEPELPHYQLNIAAAHLKLAKSVTLCLSSTP